VQGDAPAITLPASDFTRARRLDGEEFRFEAAVSKGEAGGREIYTIIMRDVTSACATRASAPGSLSLLLATLESTADGIIVVDRGGNVVALQPGLPHRLADRGRDVVRPRGRRAARGGEHAAARSGAVPRARARARRAPESESFDVLEFADGRIVERIGRPQRLGERIVGRVWSFRDVTDRARAVEALRQSEASARSFVEHSPYGICRTTPEGRVITVNPALVRMLGYDSADEILRRPGLGVLRGAGAARGGGLQMDRVRRPASAPRCRCAAATAA
jgi:two-component system sensor histidine kinase/response regulator